MKQNKLAAIDIGTNSFHLIIASIKSGGSFEIIDREKEVIRLGEGSPGDIKKIKEDAIERAIETLKRFKGIADSHNAKLRAVATSAVRESKNKNEFIGRILENTGIEIEVISGSEEARLIYLGILKAVPAFNKKCFTVDIGGGSTEFILGKKGKINYSVSLKLGAVRLTQKFFPDGIISDSQVRDCRNWVKGEIFHAVKKIKKYGRDIAVGSSGTIISVASMIAAFNKEMSQPSTLNNFEISKKDLQLVEKKILNHYTIEKRKKIDGLDAKRADIIPAGIIILSQIFESFEIDKMIVSDYALREGIIIETMQKLKSAKLKPKLHDIRYESVIQLADSCLFDKRHCAHVASLALQIFDQLKELHELKNECREYLEAAARLHDIGYHIGHSQHHRHSQYIIKNSAMLGFTENEINIIANVARYHRKSHPKQSHNDFAVLTEKNQRIVEKLAAILRIADAFDRTHSMNVQKIIPEIIDGKVVLNLTYHDSAPEIELWNFDRRKNLFEDVFKKKVIVNL